MNKDEAKKVIINNQINYKDFANCYNITIKDSIKIFQYLDLKKCSKNNECVNFNGPIQSRENFRKNRATKDGLLPRCKKCIDLDNKKYKKYSDYFKLLSCNYTWNYFEYPIISTEMKEKWDYLDQVIKENYFTYRHVATILNLSLNYSIWLFQILDIKVCSRKSCKSPDGRIQSRENFHVNINEADNLRDSCVYCFRNYSQSYYQENKEYHNWKTNQYYWNNKEYMNKLSSQNYYNKKDMIDQLHSQYGNSYSKYSTYVSRISYAEKVRKDPQNTDFLQVKCSYCNKWFNPSNYCVQARIKALEGREKSSGTENRFYCSNECKKSCPIYQQKDYSKEDSKYYRNLGTSREVQPELRQLVFERDNWTCQKCSTYKDDLAAGISLHCHHKEGIRYEPIESADIDMCITVCSECHKKIHQIPGCTYQDMQCQSELIKDF